MKKTMFAAALCAACCAAVQAFPEGAALPTAAEIASHLSNKVFDVKIADGNTWRLQYKDTGWFWINTSTGFADSGTWQAEEGRLCAERKRGNGRDCNDVRMKDGLLHLKRQSGEIIVFVAR